MPPSSGGASSPRWHRLPCALLPAWDAGCWSLRESATAGALGTPARSSRRPGANVAGGADHFGACCPRPVRGRGRPVERFDPAAASAADRRKNLPARGRTRRTPGRGRLRRRSGSRAAGSAAAGEAGPPARRRPVDRASSRRDRRRSRAAVASHGPSHATDSDQSRATRRGRDRGRRAGERRAWSPPWRHRCDGQPAGKVATRTRTGVPAGGAGAPCRLGVSNPRERDLATSGTMRRVVTVDRASTTSPTRGGRAAVAKAGGDGPVGRAPSRRRFVSVVAATAIDLDSRRGLGSQTRERARREPGEALREPAPEPA